jgi:hypothetical protein
VQAAAAESANDAPDDARSSTDSSDWIQTGLSLAAAVNPFVGGAYLGSKAVKHFEAWLDEPNAANDRAILLGGDERTTRSSCPDCGALVRTDWLGSQRTGVFRIKPGSGGS